MNFGSNDNLTSLFTAIGNKLRKKVSFELKTQAQYDALVQAGTVDPNVDYHIYDADMTGAPIDDSTTAVNKVWSSNKVNGELVARDMMGAKNLLPNNAVSQEINGITFTVNADGSVDVSGTSTEYAGLILVQPMSLKKGKYILSGYGGTAEQGNIVVGWNNGNNNAWDAGNGAIVELSQNYDDVYLVIQVNANQTVNYTCYPMLRLASIADDTYEPYAMTNRELTVNKADNSELTNSHKATVLTVSTSSWVTDTTSQSGTTLYKKEISLSHVYVPCPDVAIGASGTTLPTKAQQTAYDLIQYATVDSSTNKLYLYASAVPSTQFYIKVTGVD